MNNFTARLHQFHTHLLLGKAGSTVLGYADLVLLFLAATGIDSVVAAKNTGRKLAVSIAVNQL